jgi:hypothetical protein
MSAPGKGVKRTIHRGLLSCAPVTTALLGNLLSQRRPLFAYPDIQTDGNESAMNFPENRYIKLSETCEIAGLMRCSTLGYRRISQHFRQFNRVAARLLHIELLAVERPPNRLPERLTTLAHITRASTRTPRLAPATQTILSVRTFYVGLDGVPLEGSELA